MKKHANKINPAPDTKDLKQRQRLIESSSKRLAKFDKEIDSGAKVLSKFNKTVTIFGSARFKQNHPAYKQARMLAKMLSEDGMTIVSGGGSGVMQAANHGAADAQERSIGFNIQLPYEQILNRYVTDHVAFHYFFTRKVMLTFFADAYVYFPGGFGTLDELFEVLTLVQTKKMERVPIFLVGKHYWRPLDRFIKKLAGTHLTISPGDVKLYTITDDLELVRCTITKTCQPRMTQNQFAKN